MPIDATIPLGIQPQNGMRQLSDLLGVKERLQSLDIGQQQLEQQRLQTQQAQQVQNERQAINSAISDPSTGVRNPDGTFNINRALQMFPQIAPQTWAQYGQIAAHSLQSVNDYLTSKQRVGQDAATAVGGVLRSAVGTNGKPKLSLATLNSQLSSLETQNQGNQPMQDYISSVRNMILNHADDPEQLNSLLGGLADASVGNATLRESQKSDTQLLNNGRANIPVNVQPGNGPVGQATGVPTANQLGPGQSVQLTPGPDGNLYQVVRDPTSGAVTNSGAVGTAPGAPAAPPPQMPYYRPGQVKDIEAAQQEVQQVRTAAAQATTNRHITDTLLDLTTNAKDLGPNSDKWAHVFGTVGMAFDSKMPEVQKYQEINAYLDRMALQSAQVMGLGTDAARQMAANAVGTTQMGRDALREKIRFVDAMNSGLEAYRMGLDHAVGVGGNQDFAAKRRFDAQWAQNADPLVFRLRNAQLRGDSEDYQATLARIRKMPEAQRNAVLSHAQTINSLLAGGQQ